jgi:acyl-CoA synthetase (AMP-forming)/AMP-acid ligase II/alkylation response protein AidB-like acyl-CoA dehydrogenase/acyl carrier protein
MSTGVLAPTNGIPDASIAEALSRRAQIQPDAPACLYLADGDDVRSQLTFAGLHEDARAIAARLQGLGAGGECAILLYQPGLEFIGAFVGCLYAGVIAVPLPVPRAESSIAQFVGIVDDVRARIVLTTASVMNRLARMAIPRLDQLICLTSEDTPRELGRAWRPPATKAGAVAYLQYTSGSTALRKGVAISESNVVANLLAVAERFQHHDASVSVNWLPHTHDLGLVAGILQPIYHGHLNVLMSPTAFVQQPMRWLNAISRYRGTYSCSPNFGYDLCVRRTTAEQRAHLDLSCWEVALNGAEPVRRHTLDEFTAAFGPCGFRREAIFPAYGLAEATLVVSGGPRKAAPVSINVDAAELERDRVFPSAEGAGTRPIVGCGHPLQDTAVAIADPATGARRAEGEIGEIWVHGPGVANGYWQREDATEQTFRARIADSDDRPYLRTGDLGFLQGRELFITGRLKDLIIIRGANHYPHDIEFTIERSHAAFRPGCGAAFSVDADGTERLVVVFELEREHLRGIDFEELTRLARSAVAEEHELHLQTLVILKTNTVPRTTSGKIQRRQCRAQFLSGDLPVVWSSTETDGAAAPPEGDRATSPNSAADRMASLRADDLNAWLRDYADERIGSRLMDERRSVAPHVILDFGNRGILGLQVARDHGGLGFGFRDTLSVIEQLGAIDQTLAMMTIVHNSLGIWPILHHASAALKDDLLPRLATGRELVAFAITEPGAGSNPQAIASTAAPDGDGAWRLHGQKSWSGSAGWASVINVFVQHLDTDGGPRGMSGFVVPRNTKGLRMGPEALTFGMRGMVQNTIYLEGARVTRGQCLGDPGSGLPVAHDAMMQGRLAIAAACVGGIKRCVQLLVRYAGRRTISTGRLLDNPVLQERVGALSVALAGIESLVASVAHRLDAGAEVPPDVLVACKTAGSEWLWRAADDLVQFLGGRGYIEPNIAAQLLRDARVTRILEGPTEALETFLGSRVVNDGAALHRFLVEELGAAAVSARLSEIALEIHERCTSADARFGDRPADARRHAYALIGQVATEALLLAATPHHGAWPYRPWAEQRFEAAAARALSQAAASGGRLGASALESVVNSYVAAIGDIEQSLPGEDYALDEMLRRADRRAPDGVAAAEQTKRLQSVDAPPSADIAARPTGTKKIGEGIDAEAIERFIVKHVSAAMKLPVAAIDPRRSLFDYGVDSVTAVMLTATLEEWLGLTIRAEILFEMPVMRALARRLATERSGTLEAPSGSDHPVLR